MYNQTIFFNMSHWQLTELPRMHYFFANMNGLTTLVMPGSHFYHELKNVLL